MRVPLSTGSIRLPQTLEVTLDESVSPSVSLHLEGGGEGKLVRPEAYLEATLGGTEGQRSFLHKAQLATLSGKMVRFAR